MASLQLRAGVSAWKMAFLAYWHVGILAYWHIGLSAAGSRGGSHSLARSGRRGRLPCLSAPACIWLAIRSPSVRSARGLMAQGFPGQKMLKAPKAPA